MTYTKFREIVISLDDYTAEDSFELFVAERGWQEWMNEYYDESGENDRITPILSAVWGMRENPIKGVKAATKMTNKNIAEMIGIPLVTVDTWSRGFRQTRSDYTTTMIAYIIFAEKGII